MYRIDENTWIDTSLVTCAEYQLFIDEQRTQSKFRQPDHWESHKFLRGQAYQPILGVRSTDAQDFCNWLISRQKNRWHFRLPLAAEAIAHPLSQISTCLIGYWTHDKGTWSVSWNTESQQPTAQKLVALDITRDIELAHDLIHAHDLAHELMNDFYRARTLSHTRNNIYDLTQKLTHTRDASQVHNRSAALIHAHDLAHTLAHNIADARTLASDLVHAHDLSRTLTHPYHTLAHARALTRAHDHIQANTIIGDFQTLTWFQPVQLLAQKIKLERQLNRFGQDPETNRYLWAYFVFARLAFDLTLLKERIAGNYPAFEGIRLVKERVRE